MVSMTALGRELFEEDAITQDRIERASRIFGRDPDMRGGHIWGTTRDKTYKKWLEEHPWVNWDRIGDLPKIYLSKIGYEITRKLDKPVQERNTIFKDIFYAFMDGYRIKFKKDYENRPFEVFPRIRTELSLAEGAAKIHSIYTVEVGGKDMPVFLRKFSEKDDGTIELENVNIDDLRAKVQHALDNNASFYDKMGEGSVPNNFINNDFIKFAVDKYTRGDYNTFEQESNRINRGMVKSHTWLTHQYGDRDLQEEANLPADLQGVVKIHNTPVKQSGFFYWLGRALLDNTPRSGKMWWYNKVGDIVYDIIDTVFDPVQELLERTNVPEEGKREIYKKEWDTVQRALRGLFNPRPTPYLAYSLN